MPFIPLVTAKENPLVGAPETRATAEQFGAGIGRALQGLGDEIGAFGGVLAARDRQKQQLEAASLVAQADYTERYIHLKTNTEAGGSELYGEAGLDYGNWVEEQTKDIKDPKVAAAVKRDLLANTARVKAQAAKDAFALSDTKATDDVNQGLQATVNKVRSAPDMYDMALAEGTKVINAAPNIGETQKQVWRNQWTSTLTRARFETLLEAADTPAQIESLKQELGKEDWQKLLSSEDYNFLQNGLDSATATINTTIKSEVSAMIEDFGTRNVDDPARLIPHEELTEAWPMVQQYGTPSQVNKFMKVVRQQEKYRFDSGQPMTIIKEKQKKLTSGKKVKGDWTDAETQAAFTLWEMDNTEASAGAALRAVGDNPEQAATVVMKTYERPAAWAQNQSIRHRQRSARLVYNGGGGETAQALRNFFMEKGGLSKAQASGVVGNFIAESSLQTGAHGDKSIPGGSRGFGQWNRERLRNLKRFAGAYEGGGIELSAADMADMEAYDNIVKAQDKAFYGPDADMMTYANNTGMGGIELGDISTPDGMKVRGQQALQIADLNSIPYDKATPLTKEELAEFTQTFRDGSATDVQSLLASLNGLGPQMSRAALNQIGATEPIYAYAARLDTDAAGSVIRGQKALTADKSITTSMAASAGTQGAIDDAYRNKVGVSLSNVDARQSAAVRDAADAYYYDKFFRNTGTFNRDQYETAIEAVLGRKIGNVNGVDVLMAPGVTETQLQAAVDTMTPNHWVEHSLQGLWPKYRDGTIVDSEDLNAEAKLRAIDGEGTYVVELGDLTYATTGRTDDKGRVEYFAVKLDAEAVNEILAVTIGDVEILNEDPYAPEDLGEIGQPLPGEAPQATPEQFNEPPSLQ